MQTLRIFISSPGDVADERQIAGKVIERLQGKYLSFVRLDDVFWEQKVIRSTAHYQDELVNPGINTDALTNYWTNKLTKDHELLELAEFDLQSRANKIFLPTAPEYHPRRSIHLGRHLTEVSARLAAQMDQVVRIGAMEGWGKDRYREELRLIIREERSKLRLGERVLNRNFRPW